MANAMDITINGDREVIALLERLPKLVVSAGGPADRAMTAATTVLQRRAISIAPDSQQTGSRKKQSKKSKKIWRHKLNQKIRKKILRRPDSVYGIVGPKSPEGNMAHFVNGKPRRLVLWGKATRVAMYRYERNWMLQAFDESRGEQLSAMRESLRREIDQQMRGAR